MTPSTSVPVQPKTPATPIRPELLRLLDDLPQPKQVELLNYARFLRHQAAVASDQAFDQHHEGLDLRLVSAESLIRLTGLVALGGDAVIDSEALYDGF